MNLFKETYTVFVIFCHQITNQHKFTKFQWNWQVINNEIRSLNMSTYILRLTMPRSSDDVLLLLSSGGPIFVCSNLHKQAIFMALQWAILSVGHSMLFSYGDCPGPFIFKFISGKYSNSLRRMRLLIHFSWVSKLVVAFTVELQFYSFSLRACTHLKSLYISGWVNTCLKLRWSSF